MNSRCRKIYFVTSTCIFFSLLIFCSDRDRTNPLDPDNPDTEGMLNILDAIAGNHMVEINWDQIEFDDVRGLELVRIRAASGDTIKTHQGLLPRDQTSFVDSTAINDSTYTYFLQLVVSGQPEKIRTNEDLATPGTEEPWVLEGTRVSKMSPDGRDIVLPTGRFSFPFDLGVNITDGSVWVVDRRASTLTKFDSTGSELIKSTVGIPVSLAIDQSDGSVWVANFTDGLSHFSPSGALIASFPEIKINTSTPDDIAVDSNRKFVWITSTDENVVTRISPDGSLLRIEGFSQPQGVAVDENDGSCWIGSRGDGSVKKINSEGGLILDLAGFPNPLRLSVDQRDGSCWIADITSDKVIKLDKSGDFILEIAGLSNPLGVTVNVITGTCWIANFLANEVIKVAPDGKVLGRTNGLLGPVEVQIKP